MERVDGYAAIRDYAVVGDGRTVALVALDGSVDWLCLPDVDSPSVFARILDAGRGGAFELAPEEPYAAERAYVPGTNVLETTFRTASGSVRVTDAMTVVGDEIGALRQLVRRVEGLAGDVPMRWRVEPRFGYGARAAEFGLRHGVPVAASNPLAVGVTTWDAGERRVGGGAVGGRFDARPGRPALLALVAANREPLVLPPRSQVEEELERTLAFWRGWSGRATYGGAWRDAVLRSALVLKLLVYAPSGGIVAAPTASLPEWIGGRRNWDYRYTWIRDASFTLNALLHLGYHDEAQSFFWWLLHASRLTLPRLQVLYRVDGDARAPERELPLDGYRGSRPVRIGNRAVDQLQLDVYGALLESVYRYHHGGSPLDRATGRVVARIADYVTRVWQQPDAGIWEVRSRPAHFVQSKAMCWIALDRACSLAAEGVLPDRRRRWRAAADRLSAFVEHEGWDEERRSYIRSPEHPELDASLLTLPLLGYGGPAERLRSTVEAVERELRHGPYVMRYTGEDGVGGSEGGFLTCSFWLANALAECGRADEAAELMDELVALGNDVGLFAEEAHRTTGAFLGNFPQALTHLALVNAAVAIARAAEREVSVA